VTYSDMDLSRLYIYIEHTVHIYTFCSVAIAKVKRPIC